MKMEYYNLLKELGYLDENDFIISDEDRKDGIETIEEKLDANYYLYEDENYAIYKNYQGKVVTIFKGQQGIDRYVKEVLENMENEDLIKLIEWLPGKGHSRGYRGVLEEWNWKLQDHGNYVINEQTEIQGGIKELVKVANDLDTKGFQEEANVIDKVLQEACATCPEHKKKKKNDDED